MASRQPPRRPDWLAATPPERATEHVQAIGGQAAAQDGTVRALDFAGTAARRPPTARAAATTGAAPSPLLRPKHGGGAGTATPSAPGSALGAEPAYRAALARLSQQRTNPPSTARPATSSAALPSSRLDSLLAGRPTSAPAPPPSSRLDALLARPAPAIAAAASRRAAAGAGLLRPTLTPVAEDRAGSACRTAQPPAAAAAAQGSQLERARASAPPAEGLYGDPGLHDRLRQRIEQSKAQMRAQLSPMFRLSEALLGAEGDPARAADALDVATGVAANGFEQLAARPGSRGGSGAGGGPAAAAAQAGGAPLLQGPSSPSLQQAPEPRVQLLTLPAPAAEQQRQALQQQQQEQRQQQQQPALPTSSGLDEVDSLVANARAAAERAQSAIAGLASPPRDAVTARTASPGPASLQRGGGMQVAAAAQAGGLQLAVPADSESLVAHLRQQAEELVRSECEVLVAGMHSILDSLLASLQHAALQQQQQQQQPQQLRAITADAPGSDSGAVLAADSSHQQRRGSAAAMATSCDGSQAGGSGGEGIDGGSFFTSGAAASQRAAEENEEQGLQQWLSEQSEAAAQHEPHAEQAGRSSSDVRVSGSVQPLPGGSAGRPPQQHPPTQPATAAFDFGFGSPIKLPQPSPAKLSAVPSLRFAGAPAAEARGADSGVMQQQGTAARSVSFGARAAAAADADQATPALRLGGRLDAYMSARSAPLSAAASSAGLGGRLGLGTASLARHSSYSGFDAPAASAASGTTSAPYATPHPLHAASATPVVGGVAAAAVAAGGRKDLDSLLGSIRQLAADMRASQAALAPERGVQAESEAGDSVSGSAARPPYKPPR